MTNGPANKPAGEDGDDSDKRYALRLRKYIDVVVEDPIGKSVTNPEGTGVRGKDGVAGFYDTNIAANQLTISCEETFPSSDPNEIAHILVLRSKFDNGISSAVRGVFTYRVNDAGLITNMRGYWNLDMMTFGTEE